MTTSDVLIGFGHATLYGRRVGGGTVPFLFHAVPCFGPVVPFFPQDVPMS